MKCDELKAFDVGLGQYSEDGSPCVVAFDADRNPRLLNEKVYLKSEVDAAIDELKAEHHKERHEYIKMIAELKQNIEDAKATAYAESVDAGMITRQLLTDMTEIDAKVSASGTIPNGTRLMWSIWE